jgi:hypothetical protein
MSDIVNMGPTDTCKSGNFRRVTTNGMTAYECVDKPDITGNVIEVFTMFGYIVGPIVFIILICYCYRKCTKRKIDQDPDIIQNNQPVENKPKEEVKLVENKPKEENIPKEEENPKENKSDENKTIEEIKQKEDIKQDLNNTVINIDDKPIINTKEIKPILKKTSFDIESSSPELKVTQYNPTQIFPHNFQHNFSLPRPFPRPIINYNQNYNGYVGPRVDIFKIRKN